MEESTLEFVFPGLRFHPPEEELLDFYLKNMVFGRKLRFDVIGFLNIYCHDPWDLPRLANIGEREWYFFVPRDRKNGSGGRPNRTTAHGFWQATGSDRKILSLSDPKRIIGLKKTLVFYQGRAPRGSKTDWIMNEYRLPDTCPSQKEIVLCKIYRKATSLKVLEQRAAMEEEMKRSQVFVPSSPIIPPMVSNSYCGQLDDLVTTTTDSRMVFKKEDESLIVTEETINEKTEFEGRRTATSTTIQLPEGKEKPEVQVPIFNIDCGQESSFWTPLCSSWFDNLTPFANLLNS